MKELKNLRYIFSIEFLTVLVELFFKIPVNGVVACESTLAKQKHVQSLRPKSSRTASVPFMRVSLQVAWNIFLNSVTESAFSKVSGLTINWNGLVYGGLCGFVSLRL